MSSEEIPTVALGGTNYSVPPAALREMSQIVPAVLSLGKLEQFCEEQIRQLGRIAYLGIKAAAPDMTFDDFLGLPTTVAELMTALPIVTKQAGMKIKENTPPGEVQGTVSPQISS